MARTDTFGSQAMRDTCEFLALFDQEIEQILSGEPLRASQLLLVAYLRHDHLGQGDLFAAALTARLALMNARNMLAR